MHISFDMQSYYDLTVEYLDVLSGNARQFNYELFGNEAILRC
jgi:hypothetical protein